MYDIRSAMLNIGIVFTPGKFKINLEKTWKTPGILVNLRSTDPAESQGWGHTCRNSPGKPRVSQSEAYILLACPHK